MTTPYTARILVLHLIASALASACVATGVAWWMHNKQRPAFATLDIAELYRLKERQVAAVLVQRDGSEAERLLAIQQAAAFGPQVSKILETLPQDCDCLVLAPGAVLGSGTQLVDLTPDVRRRLGLPEARP